MKPLHTSLGPALAACSLDLLAQSLGPLVINPSPAVANQPVSIIINSPSPAVACGLEISLGDGTVRQLRSENFPVTVEHVYSHEGIYAIAVTGRGIVRGIRSLLPCEGSQSIALQVSARPNQTAMPRGPALIGTGENDGAAPLLLGGMRLNSLSADQARLTGFPAESYLGLAVQAVEPGSAAHAAGLLAGDVLSHLDDEGATPSVAARARDRLSQGRPIQATVFRSGQWLSASLRPASDRRSSSGAARLVDSNQSGSLPASESPPGASAARQSQTPKDQPTGQANTAAKIGVNFTPIDAATASKLGFPIESYRGLLIKAVTPNSPAAAAGLSAGDVLSHVDDEAAAPQSLEQAEAKLARGLAVKVAIFRAGQWLGSSLPPQAALAAPWASQKTDSKAAEFLKNLGQLSKALDDLGRALSGAKSPPSQAPRASIQSGGASGQNSPTASGTCSPGAQLEPREFTQPEILGRPRGERAQMCFYRMEGSRAEYLNFFSTGHFYHTSIAGSGGFASTGAVYGTVRGSYGFQAGNILVTRIGYQGTGVSQSNRGAGTQKDMDVSGQTRLDNEFTLPNCQKISYRDEAKRVQYDRTTAHPSHLVVDGVRWERYSMDCPAWKGWVGD